jgi:hypothetical protein
VAFLQPGEWVHCIFNITNSAIPVDNKRGGTLDELRNFIQPVPMIYLSRRIRKNRKGQVKNISIPLSFINGASQDEEDVTIFFFETLIQPA